METKEDNQIQPAGGAYHVADDIMALPACHPKVVGDFILTDNNKLASLAGVPTEVTGVFYVDSCSLLTSWEGSTLSTCGELDIMLSSIRTCTGGPSTVRDRILVAPGTDLYDLPGGTWSALIFGDGYMTYERSDVTKVVEYLHGASTEELEEACARDADQLGVWVASRMLGGHPPFRILQVPL